MKTYIKPDLNVVELSVKESIAAFTRSRSSQSFGFGSKLSLNKISTTLATLTTSDVDTTSVGWLANNLYI